MEWKTEIERKTFYVPKRQHDERYEDDQKSDPNTDSPYVQYHTLRNSIDEIEVQVWNAHGVVKEQSRHTQKHEGQYKREDYRAIAHKEIDC